AGNAARFNYPSGLAVDTAGSVYVADSENNQIRKVTPVGTNWVVTTLAGGVGSDDWADTEGSADGTGSAARFTVPRGVAVDSAGNVYVADTENCTIRKITLIGANTALAGRAGMQCSANGVAGGACLKSPAGLAADSATNFW